MPTTAHGDVLNQLTMAVKTRVMGTTLTMVGTPGNGTVDVTAAFSQSILNNNFATVATQINDIRAVLIAAGIMD